MPNPGTPVRTGRYILPPIESGYHLDPQRGFFEVVYPLGVDKTNLVYNPSVETNTTGYNTNLGGSITRDTTVQKFGIASLRCNPSSTSTAGWFYDGIALIAGTQYFASVWFKGKTNLKYRIDFLTGGGIGLGSPTKFVATGYWQRVSVAYLETVSVNRRVYVRKDDQSNTEPFWCDGLQVEADQLTTYIDGSQVGFVRNRADYYWTSTPNASPSVRIGMSRAGGIVVPLDQLGFRLLSIIGLGMGGIVNQMTPLARGGAYYGGTVFADRQFTLVGQVDSSSGYEDLSRKRQGLVDLLKPDVVSPPQPLILYYTPTDDCGNITGETNEIVCVTDGDVGGITNNLNSERLVLTFRLFMPFVMQQVGNVGSSLDYANSLTSNYIANRVPNLTGGNTWQDGPIVNGEVRAIVHDPLYGRTYFAGNFTLADGVTVNRLFYLDNTGVHALNAAGTVGVNGMARALAVDALGNVYIGGAFTTAGGAAAKGFARYNVATDTFTAYNPATSTFVSVYAVAIDELGLVYVGGDFTNWNGNANGDYISGLNPVAATWFQLDTGTDDIVSALAVGDNGFVYLAGDFLNAGGSPLAQVGYWTILDPTNFYDMGGGLTGGGGAPVTLAVDTAGNILLGGLFPEVGGLTIPNAARWNGSQWSQIATGLDTSFLVQSFAIQQNGTVYAVGQIFGGPSGGEFAFSTQGGAWVILDAIIAPPPNPIGQAVAVLHNGSLYIGLNAAGVVITSGTQSITNTGSAPAGPIITFTGPGTLRTLTNVTTNKTIYFNLSLQAGEIAVLDLSSQSRITFTSSARGNVLYGIAPGSQESEFNLRSGINIISLNIWGVAPFAVDSNTDSFMTWRITSHSIDAAAIGRYLPQ